MSRFLLSSLLVSLLGCGSSTRHLVRLDTGQGEPLLYTPRRDVAPVALSQEEFNQAISLYARSVPVVDNPLEYARQLFGVPERSGWYRYEHRGLRLLPSEPDSGLSLRLLPEQEELTRDYLNWCARSFGGGDCLRLLRDKPFLDGDAKYALAMAIAHTQVLGAMKAELSAMVSPQAVVATVVGGLTMYAILLALPEPLSKGVAALMTLGAICYLGWDTVVRLIDGWLVLMKEVDEASTFDGIYASGEKFGGTLGQKAARAFVMLGTVAMGGTASGMATTLPKLPGAAQAAVVAEAQMNLRWTAPALAQVESVALTAQGVTLTVAPNALAMAARDASGGSPSTQAPPPSSGGPGEWVKVNEAMPEHSRRYQAQVTGAPEGYAYVIKNGDTDVKFDGYAQGVLTETKSAGYAQWITNKFEFFKNFQGRNRLLDQAQRQLGAANGTPLRWVVAEEKLANALKLLFKAERINIDVIHVPPARPTP